MSEGPCEMLNRCIEQHDRTGYSGVLKWVELLAIRDHITELEAEVERLNGLLKGSCEK